MPSRSTTSPVRRDRSSQIAARQAPLRQRYQRDPAAALIVDRGRTVGRDLADPVRTHAVPGEEYRPGDVEFRVGTHRGVGGLHDAPNPGEILCATLAACQDSTIRMVANLLGVRLTSLTVEVDGRVDLRGTLAVDTSVPVGFQSMSCRTRLRVQPGTDRRTIEVLAAAAERSCVVLDTLRSGVPIESEFDMGI